MQMRFFLSHLAIFSVFLHIVLVGFSFHGWDNWDHWWIITTVLGLGEIRRKLLKYVIIQCTVHNECLQLNSYLFMYIIIDISKPPKKWNNARMWGYSFSLFIRKRMNEKNKIFLCILCIVE